MEVNARHLKNTRGAQSLAMGRVKWNQPPLRMPETSARLRSFERQGQKNGDGGGGGYRSEEEISQIRLVTPGQMPVDQQLSSVACPGDYELP